jgi:peptide/nickel transport system permease protein
MAAITDQTFVPSPEEARARADRLRRRATAERRFASLSVVIGVAIIVGIPLISLAGSLFGVAAHPNRPDFAAILQPPSWSRPFGTDAIGRDVFARVLAATPLDYEVSILTTVGSLVIGVTMGIVAGYFGGSVDTIIMRTVDSLIAFPFFIFVMAFVAVYGEGLVGIYVGLIAFGWAFFARITRAEMLAIRDRQFINAAQLSGLPTRRILLVHALPNVLRPNFVIAMATVVWNILTLAALSYLGLGVQPPTPEWGAIIANGQTYLFSAWWVSTLPGFVVVLVGVGFSLVGDGMADRLGYDFRLTV